MRAFDRHLTRWQTESYSNHENRGPRPGDDPEAYPRSVRAGTGNGSGIPRVNGNIVLRKAPKKLNLTKWKGYRGKTFAQLGYSTVNAFMDDVRGR